MIEIEQQMSNETLEEEYEDEEEEEESENESYDFVPFRRNYSNKNSPEDKRRRKIW